MTTKRLYKEIGKAFLLGIIIFVILILMNYYQYRTFPSLKNLSITFVYNQVYTIVLYLSNMFFIVFLLKRYKNELFTFINLTKGILGSVLITIVVLFLLRMISEIYMNGENFQEFLSGEKVQYYTFGFFISLIVTSIFYGIFYYRHIQEHKLKEQKIIAGTASAKFDALKNQLDPHFLFNSLNVLTSLIEENPEAATKFTTSLSKVYRYVLEQKNKDLVSLEEELKFANLYMTLIKMRFEESIVFTSPKTLTNPQAKVVPLSLQLVLENAVKHNKVTSSNKLYITITEEANNLIIKNNIQPKEVLKEGTGVGLRNIKQRYYLLTDRPVSIQKDDKEFFVYLPLLTKKTTIMNTQKTYISEKKYHRAKERVEKLKGFYIHFTIYLIMVPVFIYLNMQSDGFPWAIFPIAGWGFGVAGHAMEAFNYNPLLGKNWEEKKIKEFMKKDDFNTFK